MQHTGLPLTNNQDRESFIFTYAGPLPVSSKQGKKVAGRRRSRWPVGSYGGPPTEPSGYNKNFLQCCKEVDALGYCDTNPLYRQLLGLELTHPAVAPASGAEGVSSSFSPFFRTISEALVERVGEQMLQHPQEYLEEIQYDVDE